MLRSPEDLVSSLPSNNFIVTPRDPDPEGILVNWKFNTGGVADEDTVELDNNVKLEALTVAVEGIETIKEPEETDGVLGRKVVSILLG